MEFIQQFLAEATAVIERLDTLQIEKTVHLLSALQKTRGRLFILGVGGSAGNASHAVNDFRKIGGFEAYTPVDNVSELTARTNDEGWPSIFSRWLEVSKLNNKDTLFVLSVGGGDAQNNVSPNLVNALRYGKEVKANIIGIVGRDGGYTKQVADACVLIPSITVERETPYAEAFQAVIWHLLVTHPLLKIEKTKWETVACQSAQCS